MIASEDTYKIILRDKEVLKQLIQVRLRQHFYESKDFSVEYEGLTSPFSKLSVEEYLVFLIALMPSIAPGFYESVIADFFEQHASHFEPQESGTHISDLGNFLAFGGKKGKSYRGILPTIETILFILAGNNQMNRVKILRFFDWEANLIKQNLIKLVAPEVGEPYTCTVIALTEEAFEKITAGKTVSPRFGFHFPAKRISTQMDWQDIVLNNPTEDQINDIRIWLKSNTALMQKSALGRKVKQGYKSLFYGPPGTGKTLAATVLGKEFNKDLYRIDLSQVISKYIGETEKNLERLFQLAENKNWILFFDEADSIWGKRTDVGDAHDRYANQNVSYLLQRVEDYPGLIILASNLKSNIDKAFSRRFNSIIKFPMPNEIERLQIFKKTVPTEFSIHSSTEVERLIMNYELSGGNILNIVHYACLRAQHRNSREVLIEDVIRAIKNELSKEGKAFKHFAL